MPAPPLESFLRMVNGGMMNNLTPEMYAAFGGDAMLQELRKYDPNARFLDTTITSGGEAGGDGVAGKRLEIDVTKLPQTAHGNPMYDLRNTDHTSQMYRPNNQEHSDLYGDVTNMRNLVKDKDPGWTKIAPLVVAALAPMAGGALYAAGIGAAGGTAGVTGAAAGLGAGNIAAGGASSLPGWATQQLMKSPQYAQQAANGKFDLTSLLSILAGAGGQAAGINPSLIKGALTLAQLAKGRP